MKNLAALPVLLAGLLCLAASPLRADTLADAQSEAAATAGSEIVAATPAPIELPAIPDAYQPGKTTRAEAEAFWGSRKILVVGSGKLLLAPAAALSGRASAEATRIDLVDTFYPEFEDLNKAQFAFFDGLLYQVQTTLSSAYERQDMSLRYSTQEIAALKAALIKRHGKPDREERSVMAGKKGPDVFIWNIRGNTLVLRINFIHSSLSFINPALKDKAQKHIRSECRRARISGSFICP